MSHLDVCVRLHGAVIEQRLLRVVGPILLGDGDGSAVCFPGASLLIEPDGSRLTVRGHRLAPGQPFTLSLGAVEITLEAVRPRSFGPVRNTLGDMRLLVAVIALLVGAASFDALAAFMDDDPVMSALFSDPAPSGAGIADEAVRIGSATTGPEATPVADEPAEVFGTPVVHYPSAVYRDVP